MHAKQYQQTPDRRCWQNLIRVGIVEEKYSYHPSAVDSLPGIDWLNCSNVVVLKLWGLDKLRGDSNLRGLRCLRSLELVYIGALDTLDGLQDLNNLNYFRWSSAKDYLGGGTRSHRTRMGQLPTSLKVLCLEGEVLLRSDVFARCTKLSMVQVWKCHAECLDFSKCTSLRRVRVSGCDAVETVDFTNCTSLECAELVKFKSLKTVSGLSPASISRLQSLVIDYCDELVEIPGLGDLVDLRSLLLRFNSKLKKLPNLKKLTRLEVLNVKGTLEEVPGLGCLRELRKLDLYLGALIKPPNLSGLEQVDSIYFDYDGGLRSLEGVFGDLPALRRLSFHGCSRLSRLPDLSGSRNLEELNLAFSGIEIGEADMCMLASLPLLHPVVVGRCFRPDIKIDVVRPKVLKLGRLDLRRNLIQWEERDLSRLPIKVSCIEWATLKVSSQVGEEGLGGMKIF